MYLYQHTDGRAVVAPAGHPMFDGDPGWVRQFPVKVYGSATPETLIRVQDSLARFISDEGWGQSDMDVFDEVSVILAAVLAEMGSRDD